MIIYYYDDQIVKSHPTRVRGLKSYFIAQAKAQNLSHPTRVRGLKLLERVLVAFQHWSHPTRVRGLK